MCSSNLTKRRKLFLSEQEILIYRKVDERGKAAVAEASFSLPFPFSAGLDLLSSTSALNHLIATLPRRSFDKEHEPLRAGSS